MALTVLFTNQHQLQLIDREILHGETCSRPVFFFIQLQQFDKVSNMKHFSDCLKIEIIFFVYFLKAKVIIYNFSGII